MCVIQFFWFIESDFIIFGLEGILFYFNRDYRLKISIYFLLFEFKTLYTGICKIKIKKFDIYVGNSVCYGLAKNENLKYWP